MPNKQTCPMCGQDEYVTPTTDGDGKPTFVCSSKHGGSGPFSFTPKLPEPQAPARPAAAKKVKKAAGTGSSNSSLKTDNLLSPMTAIMRSLPPVWVEHGVIEDKLMRLSPALWAQHVAEGGHVLHPIKKGSTASLSRFSRALQRLRDHGLLVSDYRKATGVWTHDPKVTFWALAPAPPASATLTLAQHRIDQGLPPDEYTPQELADIETLIANASHSATTPPEL